MNTLLKAILDKDLESIVTILINDPVVIDEKDSNGVAMTFLAAQTGNEKVVRYLVEYSRFSLSDVDPNNRNILHYAVLSGNKNLVQYLVEKGGMSPLSSDVNRITPFDLSMSENHLDILEYFETTTGMNYVNLYKNPIRSGMFPDPSIVRVGEDYYMVNSSFIFFPCIPISHSKDLINWEIIGHAITNPEWAYLEGLEGGRGYWAPDISYYEGKFYITATYRLNDTGTIYRKQMVVSSDKAEGPYCEPAFIDEDGIDPSIFSDDDGRRYMLLNRGARIFEISKDGTKQLSKAELLWYGDNKRAPEGPHILKKDGWYYLFLAEGGTGPGHRISVGRSKELFGNYESCPYNPIMRQMDPQAPIQRAGHGKPIQTQNGDWYMIYLCGRMIDGKYSMLGRETALDPITWTQDGWPIVNNLNGPSVLQKKPNLPEYKFSSSTHDEFEEDNLNRSWMWPRPPEKDAYKLLDSYLYLKGSNYNLDTMNARNILVRRQTDFAFNVTTKLKFPSLEMNQNLGLTCYYDENTYLKFGVYFTDKGYELKVTERVATPESTSFSVSLKFSEFIYLKIETRYLERIFFYSLDGETWENLGNLDHVYYLCDEGLSKGKRFTGAMVGMYSYSGTSTTPAYGIFDYFYYDSME